VKPLLAAIVAVAAVVAAWPAAGGAANECRGITACIPVTGPWVLARGAEPARYLITCPRGSVVGGLDAVATTSHLRVDFVAQVGAPVSPGITTTRNALFRGLLVGTKPRRAVFQPSIGCIPTSGGGGRATTAARAAVVPPGAPLDRFARNVAVRPGTVTFGIVSCPAGETLVGDWSSVLFRTKNPPELGQAGLVHVRRAIAGRRAGVTVSATDALSLDLRAAVQVGVECAR
jgi:hypothetical protein